MTLIRVIEIAPSSGDFYFGGGNPQVWIEVDWFREDNPPPDWPTIDTVEGRVELKKFIKAKNYFDSSKAYLVLHQEHTFTIGYSAP